MKVLVTGGQGFLGKAICQSIQARKGYSVRVLDPMLTDPKLGIAGSALDPIAVRKAVEGCSAVFHLAGALGTSELMSMGREAIRHNIEATWNVLTACAELGPKKVFVPAKPNDWLNMYTITKRAEEDMAWMFRNEHDLDVRVVRWRNVYGPGQSLMPIRKAVPTMICQAIQGAPVQVFGTGEQVVDLEYIDDIAKLSVEYGLGDDASPRTVDSGISTRITVNELAAIIIDLTGARSEIQHLPMRAGEGLPLLGEPMEPFAVNETAFGVDGLTTIRKGLANSVSYYRSIQRDIRARVVDVRAVDYQDRVSSFESMDGLIVVLGAPNDRDGRLGPRAEERASLAKRLADERPTWNVMPTGGFGAHFNTSSLPAWQHMTAHLLRLGLSIDRLETGVASTNTAGDAALVCAALSDRPTLPIAVVTSDFHIDRARFWFESLLAGRTIEFLPSRTGAPKSELDRLQDVERWALDQVISAATRAP